MINTLIKNACKLEPGSIPRIGFIAPYEELAETARQVCKDLDLEIEIAIGDLNEGAKIAKTMAASGIEIIVSRGCTASDIAENVSIPVVEVEVSGFDLLRAISVAKSHGRRIGAVGFRNVVYGSKNIEDILDVYIKELIVVSENDVPRLIEEAIKDNIEVIIGDVVSVKKAQSLGIGAVLVSSGKEAVSLALDKAIDMGALRRNERLRAEQFKAVLDYSYDGIITADRNGNISVINPAAERILGTKLGILKGKHVSEALPALQMEDTMKSGKPTLSRLCRIGGKLIVQNTVPIDSDGIINGVIATFQDAKYFEEVESKVRQKLHLKGHVAQYSFNDIVAESASMKKLLSQAKSYATVESTILITGETGTGKELIAQAIHNASARKNKPFIAINCAAIPVNLLESELFGYVEGAFTGASKGGKTGLFELAHGGTLFFDEIGEIPLDVQSRLLRVLQQKVVMRVGGDNVIPTDVRIIAATHRDLKEAVDENLFRRDLYYRLNVLRLHLPPLRDRADDIQLLVETLCNKLNSGSNAQPIRISEKLMEQFKHYRWEGNIRELENVLERLLILKSGCEITEDDIIELFPEMKVFSRNETINLKSTTEQIGTLDEIEKRIICQVLNETKDKDQTCEILGISPTTLWRRLSKWGISID